MDDPARPAASSSSSSMELSRRSHRLAAPVPLAAFSRSWSALTVSSSASACLHPSDTGQLQRLKTHTPSPLSPTLTMTPYGAAPEPATRPRMSRSPSLSIWWLHARTFPRRT